MSSFTSARHHYQNPKISDHRLIKAALNSARARELSHRLYRYPASMSPMIARAIIEKYSNKGDLLLDPFCGGGTSAVEALDLGRKIICSDISPFACFITKAKAIVLLTNPIDEFNNWLQKETSFLEKYRPKKLRPLEVNGKQYSPLTFSYLIKLMKDTERIHSRNARILAKVVVLNVARRSIDGRTRIIRFNQLNGVLKRVAQEVLSDLRQYHEKNETREPLMVSKDSLRVINSDAKKLKSNLSRYRDKVKLVITSPPYPSVHVLYNRWQVHGRRETDLPFRILGFNSEPPASFYTLGTRNSRLGSENYRKRMKVILKSVYELMASGAVLAQIVAFPKNDGMHIDEYEELLETTGFKPIHSKLKMVQRSVPNRKWYTQISPENRQPIEHIFLYRKV